MALGAQGGRVGEHPPGAAERLLDLARRRTRPGGLQEAHQHRCVATRMGGAAGIVVPEQPLQRRRCQHQVPVFLGPCSRKAPRDQGLFVVDGYRERDGLGVDRGDHGLGGHPLGRAVALLRRITQQRPREVTTNTRRQSFARHWLLLATRAPLRIFSKKHFCACIPTLYTIDIHLPVLPWLYRVAVNMSYTTKSERRWWVSLKPG